MEHKPLAWAEVEFPLQTGFRSTRTDDEVTVTGHCPRCHAPTSWPFPWTAPAGAAGGGADALDAEVYLDVDDDAKPEEATVVCACGHDHKDRPDDAETQGCGAFWKVRVVL